MRQTNRLLVVIGSALLASTFVPWWWQLRATGVGDRDVCLWSGPSGWVGAVLVGLAGCWLGLGGAGRAGRIVAWGLPFGGGLVLLVDTLRWPKAGAMPSRIADYVPGSAAETFGRDYSIRPGVYVGLALLAVLTLLLRRAQRESRTDNTPLGFARPKPLTLLLPATTVALLVISFRPWSRADTGWFAYSPLPATFVPPTVGATAWQSSRLLALALLLAFAAVLAPSVLVRSRIQVLIGPVAALLAVALSGWERFRAHDVDVHGTGIAMITEAENSRLTHPYTLLSDVGVALLAVLVALVILRALRREKPLPPATLDAPS